MGKKETKGNRKFFTCEVDGKKIKFPKKLRNKITSYRRVGYGPNERDVLIGEIINDKYLVFPLNKEMDLDNSELYIVERTPHDIDTDVSDKDISTQETKPEDNPEKISVPKVVNENLYKSLGLRKISSIPNDSLFKYDDIIWGKRCTGKRIFIETIDGTLTFAQYIRKKLDCGNPYKKMYNLMAEQVIAVEPSEENS